MPLSERYNTGPPYVKHSRHRLWAAADKLRAGFRDGGVRAHSFFVLPGIPGKRKQHILSRVIHKSGSTVSKLLFIIEIHLPLHGIPLNKGDGLRFFILHPHLSLQTLYAKYPPVELEMIQN